MAALSGEAERVTLGERLRALRQARGLTLKTLAGRIGVSEATLARYEQGRIANPPRDRLARLARELGVTETELLGLETEEPLDAELLLLMRQLQALPAEKRARVTEMLRLLMSRELEM